MFRCREVDVRCQECMVGCEEVVVWKSGDDKERHKLQVLEMKFLRSMR